MVRPPRRLLRTILGVALPLLLAVLCAPAQARAGCAGHGLSSPEISRLVQDDWTKPVKEPAESPALNPDSPPPPAKPVFPQDPCPECSRGSGLPLAPMSVIPPAPEQWASLWGAAEDARHGGRLLLLETSSLKTTRFPALIFRPPRSV
jgi:hypothetical protein